MKRALSLLGACVALCCLCVALFAQGVGGGGVSGLTYVGPITPGDCTKWLQAGVVTDSGTAGCSGASAVTQLLAGSGISLSPAGGTGAVTITNTGGGSSAFSALTTSSNTQCAPCTIGTGAQLSPVGSGVIQATAAPVGGISGLGTGVATWLATPSAANLGSAVTGASLTAGTDVTIGSSWPNQSVGLTSATITVNGQTCTLGSTCTIPIQTNSVSNTSQAGVNFLTSTANSVGLTVTPVNSATNAEKFEITGSSYTGNAATASAVAIGGITGLGTGVATAAAANLSANGGITTTIASGQTAMPTGALSANTCSASATTATATNTATTDGIFATYASDPTGVTGYGGGTSGGITIRVWPTANTVNFKLCNETGSSITPGALNINWRVAR